jgi:RNA polymerase sigma-70 factor, ECF subfamily
MNSATPYFVRSSAWFTAGGEFLVEDWLQAVGERDWLGLRWAVQMSVGSGNRAAAEEGSVSVGENATETSAVDWADITATLNGDDQAYAKLVRRYQSEIADQMWRFSRQLSVAEELVQEVFVEAYLSLAKFRGQSPLLHWLRKIATRVGYRYWKHESRQRARAAALEVWSLSQQPQTVSDPEEAGAIVHQVLAQLPPRDRLVLTLIYLQGCSIAETAERIGWSQTMVKVQAHRARKKLKKLIEGANHEDL